MVYEGSGVPPVVRKSPRRFERGREASLKFREGLRGPIRGPGGVGRLPRRSGRGRKAPPEVREGWRGPPKGPGGLGKPLRRSRKVQKATPEVCKGSGVPPEVRKASQRSGKGREATPDV